MGDEEYNAEGPSIKKAQHVAAAEAIQKTKYPHPPPKVNRSLKVTKKVSTNITPTVELNALGNRMKLYKLMSLFLPQQKL